MKKSKTFVKCLLAAHSLIAPISLQALELLTSQGAWSDSAIVGSSNGGRQDNSRGGGWLDAWGGAAFMSNAVSDYIEMQAAATNPQRNYTAGYTYSYQSLGHSAYGVHNNTFNVELLANGSVTVDSVSGDNFTVADAASSNTLSGKLQVASGFASLGQQIGMRISSQGVQTRWKADGITSLSALLTNHAGFDGGDGVGELYSTSFSGGAQVTDYDHVLDMSLTTVGGSIAGDHFWINNSHVGQNTVSFGSESDAFRADTEYTISIWAKKHISQDASQNSIDIVMGGGVHTETITISSTRDSYKFIVNVDDAGLKGKDFNFEITASNLSSEKGQINQYHINAFRIKAVSSVH